LRGADRREDSMPRRFGAIVTATIVTSVLLGSESEAKACQPEPIPKNMVLVASFPADGGGGTGNKGCSTGAARPADSSWLSLALLLFQLLVMRAVLAQRTGVPIPASSATESLQERG